MIRAEDARHQGRLRAPLGHEPQRLAIGVDLDEGREHLQDVLRALQRLVVDVAPQDRQRPAREVQQRADGGARRHVDLAPVHHHGLAAEIEQPGPLLRVADGDEQVDLAALQPLQAVVPGPLHVPQGPALLAGDLLQDVDVDALRGAAGVAEDEGLVGVRTDADRSRRLSGHGAGGKEEESDEQPPHSGIIANHDTSARASSFGRRNLPAEPVRNRVQVCAPVG